MPQWIHERADHIRAKNPGMPKSQSFAIATQQAYAAGKAPKDYGTPHGRHEAYQKYDDPKSTYKKTADPGHIAKSSSVDLAMWNGFSDELQKIAQSMLTVSNQNKIVNRPLKHRYAGQKIESPPPASAVDLAESSKTIQPPPATVAGG